MRVPIALPQKHRWLWISTAAVLAIVCYVLSYPISYRLLVGSDRYEMALHEAWNEKQTVLYCGDAPQLHSGACWEAWGYLRKYYYPPVEWAMDFLPVRTAVLSIAYVIEVDWQINRDLMWKDFSRNINRAMRTGTLDQFLKEQTREIEGSSEASRESQENQLSKTADE